LRVRPIHDDEVDRWCGFPLDPTGARHADRVAAEQRWVAAMHDGTERLWVAEQGEDWLGKADVAIEKGDRWTLWAPTVRPGDRSAMEALCAYVLAEATRRGIGEVEVFVDDVDALPLARLGLERAGFTLDEERVLVARDLDGSLPSPPDLDTLATDELSDDALRALCRAVGAPDDVAASPLHRVALRDGEPVGLCLAGSAPGEPTLHEVHLGVTPAARGTGTGFALFLHWLDHGRAAGATRYVGSTALANAAMRRIFDRAGCLPIGQRTVFRAVVTQPDDDASR